MNESTSPAPPATAPRIRPLAPNDRAALEACLRSDETFRAEELAVALELIDAATEQPDHDYCVRVAELEGVGEGDDVAGYICFGPTPMTQGTYDLYWIVTHARARGRRVAGALIGHMEAELRERGATGVRIETSQLEGYDAARGLYARHAYHEVGRIPDFYRAGDDLITLFKKLT